MTEGRRSGPAYGEGGHKDLISIRNGDLVAKIDKNGGFLDEFVLNTYDGPVDLIFFRQNMDTPEGPKMRGGSHICLPLFGEAENLQRHGFGRNLRWHSLNKRDPSARAFYLAINDPAMAPGAERYKGLEAILNYRIEDFPAERSRDLLMTCLLRAGREDDQQKEIVGVAPGFHPYIALPEGLRADQLNLNIGGQDRRFSAEELRSTVMVDSENYPVKVGLGTTNLEVRQRNLPVFAIWTDNPEAYICIEPTAAGTVPPEEVALYTLAPGKTKTYSAVFSWKVAA